MIIYNGKEQNDVTEIVCIVDRSGSMHSIKEDTIGGFNTFLAEQKKVEGEARMTLVLFDHEIETVVDGVDIQKVDALTDATYVPRGTTALLDAIGITIGNVERRISESNTKPKNVIVAILTDGAENTSHEYNRSQIFDRITEMTEKSWQFLYLGANQDAFSEASNLGINGKMSMNFRADGDGITKSYNSINSAVTSYRSTGVVEDGWQDEEVQTDSK